MVVTLLLAAPASAPSTAALVPTLESSLCCHWCKVADAELEPIEEVKGVKVGDIS